MRNGKYDVLSPLYSGEPVDGAEDPGGSRLAVDALPPAS